MEADGLSILNYSGDFPIFNNFIGNFAKMTGINQLSNLRLKQLDLLLRNKHAIILIIDPACSI